MKPDNRYHVIQNGLFHTCFDEEGFVGGNPNVLISLQVEHDPNVDPNMFIRDENGERVRVHRYTAPTIAEIEEALMALGNRPQDSTREIRMWTGPEGHERFNQAIADEVGHWQSINLDYNLGADIANSDSVSITERLRPMQAWHNLTQEQIINQLDQISREDV